MHTVYMLNMKHMERQTRQHSMFFLFTRTAAIDPTTPRGCKRSHVPRQNPDVERGLSRKHRGQRSIDMEYP